MNMKSIKIALVMLLMAAAGSVSAQVECSFKTALDDFLSKQSQRITLSDVYTCDSEGLYENQFRGDYNKRYNFSLEKGEGYVIDRLIAAFHESLPLSYNSFEQTQSNAYLTSNHLGYWKNGIAQSINFGSRKDHNYYVLYLKTPTDSLRRLALALTWNKGKKGFIEGTITEIWGGNPPVLKQLAQAKKEHLGAVKQTVTQMDEKGNYKTHITKNDGSTIVVNGSLGKGVISAQDSQSGNEFIDLSNASEVLAIFGGIRGVYLKTANEKDENVTITLGALAGTIMNLCKQKAGLLSTDEKQLLMDSIEELKQYSKDTFANGSLELAEGYLK